MDLIQWSLVYAEKPIRPAWWCDNKRKLNLYDRLHQRVQITKILISSVGVISQAWQISSGRESTAATSPVNKVLEWRKAKYER